MQNNHTQSASFVSLLSNVALSVLKIVTGVFGNSYALVADGIESLADCISSLVVWNGIRVASKEADFDHPYGHGKAESIAALMAGLGLWISGFIIAWQAVRQIQHPQTTPEMFTVPVLILIVVIKETLHQYTRYFAKKHKSNALMAEAAHHRSDSMTSLCVLIGLSIAVFSGGKYAVADDVAALLVTALIFRNGWNILKQAVDELMDKRVEGDDSSNIFNTIKETEGVLQVETLLIRQSGSKYHVDVHIEVDPKISVKDGHDIAHQVKRNLLNQQDLEIAHVGTHVEPYSDQSLSCPHKKDSLQTE